jgi:hypothetical protein
LGLAGFIYLDESGDTGFKFNRGSTRYFIVTLMLVSDQIPMQNAIDDLRKELHFSDDTEFKFSKSSNTVRHKFFTTLRRLDFSAYSIVTDKHDFMEYRELGHAQLYSVVVKHVLSHCGTLFDDATLVVDESTKSKRRQQALATFLRAALNVDASAPKLGKIVHHQSHRDNLLQAVDMLSGAVNAWCSKRDNTHLATLKPKIIHIIAI